MGNLLHNSYKKFLLPRKLSRPVNERFGPLALTVSTPPSSTSSSSSSVQFRSALYLPYPHPHPARAPTMSQFKSRKFSDARRDQQRPPKKQKYAADSKQSDVLAECPLAPSWPLYLPHLGNHQKWDGRGRKVSSSFLGRRTFRIRRRKPWEASACVGSSRTGKKEVRSKPVTVVPEKESSLKSILVVRDVWSQRNAHALRIVFKCIPSITIWTCSLRWSRVKMIWHGYERLSCSDLLCSCLCSRSPFMKYRQPGM